MGVLGGLGFAALFYAAAEYEHMTGWKWALASIALSATVKGLFPLSFIFVLPAQFGLFLALWWMNSRRVAALEVERAAKGDEDRQRRQERAQRAREQVDPDAAARHAAQEAREEAALRERQERVRRAREEREREERAAREQAERDEPPSGQ
ncbi:MAG: hypothetical protein DMD45_14455 [Gemmatimonadetes bacterium]|nr:MAG: hypothetical protein DMD45_14455 [Gemmatimonadota bacterium]